MGTITYSAPVAITAQKIADQICAAVEGGCGYWLARFLPTVIVKPPAEPKDEYPEPWYAVPSVWENDSQITCATNEDGDETLNPKAIERGLQWLAEHHPDRIAEIVCEEGDAETADVFLQACLFGEIRYG